MDRLEAFILRSDAGVLRERYDEALADLDVAADAGRPRGLVHGYQAYVCLYAPEEPTLDRVHALHERRNRLMAALEAEGIATRQGTHAAVLAGQFDERPESYPNSVVCDRLTFALPLYPQMTDDEQERVVEALHRLGP